MLKITFLVIGCNVFVIENMEFSFWRKIVCLQGQNKEGMDYDWTYVCTPNQTFYTEGQLLDCDIKIPLEANMPYLSVKNF